MQLSKNVLNLFLFGDCRFEAKASLIGDSPELMDHIRLRLYGHPASVSCEKHAMPPCALLEALPLLQRLALAYATPATRPALIALLALDARLAAIVRSSREPMLAQLRLAWWREQLGGSGGTPAVGDPLLEALRDWPGSTAVLAELADGWEAMTGAAPLPASAIAALAEARGAAFAALADADSSRAALRMGRNWALADIAGHLSDTGERKAALALAREQNWRQERLPRGLRPLAVLHGLAARAVFRDNPAAELTPGEAFAAIRIGLLGR